MRILLLFTSVVLWTFGAILSVGCVIALPMMVGPNKPIGEALVHCFLAFLGASVGAAVMTFANRLTAPTAVDMRSHDSRAPVLLLRNFSDDFISLPRTWSYFGYYKNFFRGNTVTLEETVASKLSRVGPVVGVARPGESVPPLGFARMWLSDDWKVHVRDLINESRLIVLILGPVTDAAEGFGWELNVVLDIADPGKVVLIVPPGFDVDKHWATVKDATSQRFKGEIGNCCCALFDDEWCANPVYMSGRNEGEYTQSLDAIVNRFSRDD